MRLRRKAIGDAALAVLCGEGTNAVLWGDVWLLDAIAQRSGFMALHPLHPLDRHQRVLNALGRDDRFEKRLVRLHRPVRGFWVKDATTTT